MGNWKFNEERGKYDKRCYKCHEYKPLDNYYGGGSMTVCKTCANLTRHIPKKRWTKEYGEKLKSNKRIKDAISKLKEGNKND